MSGRNEEPDWSAMSHDRLVNEIRYLRLGRAELQAEVDRLRAIAESAIETTVDTALDVMYGLVRVEVEGSPAATPEATDGP